jgi:hypothetical protein
LRCRDVNDRHLDPYCFVHPDLVKIDMEQVPGTGLSLDFADHDVPGSFIFIQLEAEDTGLAQLYQCPLEQYRIALQRQWLDLMAEQMHRGYPLAS